MSDKNNNELDKLFRSKLQNNGVAGNKWNVPPDDILERALSEMQMEEEQPEKKRRWPFILMFGMGVTMLATIGYLFYENQSMMIELDKKIEVLNKAQQAKNEHFNANNLANAEENNASIAKQEMLNTPATQNTSTGTEPNTKLTKTQTATTLKGNNASNINEVTTPSPVVNRVAESNNSTPIIFDQSSVSYNTPITSINNGTTRSSNYTPTTSNNSVATTNRAVNVEKQFVAPIKTRSVKGLAGIPTLNLQIDEDDAHVNLPTGPAASNEKATYTNRFTGHRFASYIILGTQFLDMNSDFEGIAGTVDNDNGIGSHLGIGTIYQLSNRWALESNLSIRRNKNTSTYTDSYAYDSNKESVDSNGDLVYNMDLKGVTPTHSTLQRVQFQVAENSMEDGDVMINKTKTESTFNVIGLNLGGRFSALQFGKFNLFLNGGVGFNWTSAIEDKMEIEIRSYNGTMMNRPAYDEKIAMNPFFYSGYIGTQLNYQLSKHIHIGLNANYEKGFNSIIIDSNNINPMSSKINTINTSLRLGYNF